MRTAALHVLVISLSLVQAGLVGRDEDSRIVERGGLLGSLGDLLGGGGNNQGNGNSQSNAANQGNGGGQNDGGGGNNDGRETVTETVKQTITVNGAGALGGLNATTTMTVTVNQNAAADGCVGQADRANGHKFEGVRLSFVTTTVQGTAKAPTVTITAPARIVTQTVTAACGKGAAPNAGGAVGAGGADGPTAAATTTSSQTAALTVIPVTPNKDGNGVGVTTIPIAGSELPKTTLQSDPLAPPPAVASVVSTTSAVDVAGPNAQDTTAVTTTTTSTAASTAASNVQADVTSTSTTTTTSESTTSSTSTQGSTQTVNQGRLKPNDPQSAVQAPATTTAPPTVTAPAQPIINLSGGSLSSQLDLGSL